MPNPISIVIPAYNEEKAIVQTIADIREGMKGHTYEIIVVDASNNHDTIKSARGKNAKIVKIEVRCTRANFTKGSSGIGDWSLKICSYRQVKPPHIVSAISTPMRCRVLRAKGAYIQQLLLS